MYLSHPEGDGHAGVEGDVHMISAVPLSDDMFGIHVLSIGSPGKGTHLPSARKVVQSPRTSWQLRPKLVPALKPNPPSAQRWPLRHRRPTVTAGWAGNDDGLRALVAVESPVDAAGWVGRVQTRTGLGWMWIRSHRHPSTEGIVRARSSRLLRCPHWSRTIMPRGV